MLSARAKRRQLERKYKQNAGKSDFVSRELAYQAKYIFSSLQRDALFKSLSKKDIDTVEGNPLPSTLSELRRTELSPYRDDLSLELKWTAYCLTKYANEIQSFIALEKAFDKNFLLGEYQKAAEILDKIENTICISQWSLEKRMLLAEYQEGFAKHKEISSSIINNTKEPLVKLVTKYQSLRIEKKLPAYKFDSSLEQHLSQYDFIGGREYIKFKLLPFAGFSLTDPFYILWVESTSSIIDRYHTFVKLCQHIVSSNSSNQEHEYLALYVAEVNAKISDTRLANVHFSLQGVLTENTLALLDEEVSNALDYYTAGDYTKAKELSIIALLNKPQIFELYIVFIKSLIATSSEFVNVFPKDALAFKILGNFWHIINKDAESSISLTYLHKSIYALGWSALSARASSFITDEYSIEDKSFKGRLFSMLNTGFINPMMGIYTYSYQSGRNFLNQYNNKFQSRSATSSLMHIILNVLYDVDSQTEELGRNISPIRLAIYVASALQARGRYESAYTQYLAISNNRDFTYFASLVPWHEEIMHGQFICLIGMNKYKEAIKLVTCTLLDNINLLHKFHNAELLAQVTSGELDDIQDQIYTPIFLHLYQAATTDIYVAYDDFMYTQGFNYPHELLANESEYDNSELVYFLRNVCKQEIYSSSSNFANQDELDNERIEICLALTGIDPQFQQSYIQEVSDTTRNIMIRKGVRQVDESKIYVDTKGIKRALDKDLRESFYRYTELISLSISQLDDLNLDANEVVAYLNQNKPVTKETYERGIKSNRSSRYRLFGEIFSKVRDKFLASNEYGLDTYLSTRIRHGTLLGHIRSVFEKHNLVTIKDSDSGDYLPNIHWQDQIGIESDELRASFNKAMAGLSLSVDFISEELKNSYLQIKTEATSSRGLFDYTYTNSYIEYRFKRTFSQIKDYDIFFDNVIDELWFRTEQNLSNIRSFILNNVKQSILLGMTRTQEALTATIDKAAYPKMNKLYQAILNCQTDISIELERVAQWFKRTSSQNINEFDLKLVLDTSLQIIRRIHPAFKNFNPTIVNGSSRIFEGEYFSQFTDIFQIIIDNLVKHASLGELNLKADIEINDLDNKINIKASNNLASYKLLDEVQVKIDEIKASFAHAKNDDSIRSERGSGYRKLKKILYNDLGCQYVDLQAGLISESKETFFEISLTFDTNSLLKR